jgi:RNA polymerase sigma factor (sigma-70 family)
MISGTSDCPTAPVCCAADEPGDSGVVDAAAEPPMGPPMGPPAGQLWDAAALEFTRWRAGEPAALERLVRLVTPTLWHVARAYQLDQAAAEDVVQTTWLALARRADSVRDPLALLGWLSVTTRREAWRVAKESSRVCSTESGSLVNVSPMPAADAEVLADADARRLWRQVARLPERCRRLLRIIAFDDRPHYSTVSAELGMPLGSIGPTRRRCLDRLRQFLAEDGWGEQ